MLKGGDVGDLVYGVSIICGYEKLMILAMILWYATRSYDPTILAAMMLDFIESQKVTISSKFE